MMMLRLISIGTISLDVDLFLKALVVLLALHHLGDGS